MEKRWQTKTIGELKEAMKSINDHTRLAAVSAVGKVILDKREGIFFDFNPLCKNFVHSSHFVLKVEYLLPKNICLLMIVDSSFIFLCREEF